MIVKLLIIIVAVLLGVALVSFKGMQLRVGPQTVGVWELVGGTGIPFGTGAILADINIGILYLFAVSSLRTYPVLCSGWANNSRSSFLGTLRVTAQIILYEVSIGLFLLAIVLSAGNALVLGFHTEFSAMFFVLFFLMSYFNVLLFSGRWLLIINPFSFIPEVVWLGIKVSFFLFLFIWTRASHPRIRFDNLKHLGWKSFLHLSLACYLFSLLVTLVFFIL